MRNKLIILPLLIICAYSISYAQQLTFECESPAIYENENRKEPKALTVSIIEGRAVIYASENIPPKSNILIKGACLALFTEEDHRLVSQTISDENGAFNFTNIPSGRYRLVVRHPMSIMNVANIPLKVVEQLVKAKSKSKKIVVYMMGTNFAENSFGKLK